MTTTSPLSPDLKRRVKQFWEAEPCGAMHSKSPEGSEQYFAEVERARYELEPFIPAFADFDGARERRLLEIGVGLGTDFVRFARAGAIVTGVDLTEHAVRLVQRRLAQEDLEGDVSVADAEHLPFESGSFDRVYSWGVLHHTPNTERAVEEAIRVAAPGAELCVMLYGRHSWVAYGLWIRHALFRGKPFRSLADVLSAHMESEGTKGFTRRELRVLFSRLEDVRIDPIVTRYDRHFFGPFVRLAPLGWFVVIRGQVPDSK